MKFNKRQFDQWLAKEYAAINKLPGIKITRRYALKLASIGGLTVASGCTADAADAALDPSSPDADNSDGHISTQRAKDTLQPRQTSTDTQNDKSSKDTGTGRTADGSPPDSESQPPIDTNVDGQANSSTSTQPLTLDELMEIIHPEAVKLVNASAPNSLETAYLNLVASQLPKLVVDLPTLGALKWDIEKLQSLPPIEIVEIEMAPGASIPLHDHRDYNGVIMGVAGEVSCVNYTQVDGEAPEGMFLLQKTAETTLSGGQTSNLTLSENNFHVLTAGQKTARLVDVFTFWPDGEGQSHWAKLNDAPVNAEGDLFFAWWL